MTEVGFSSDEGHYGTPTFAAPCLRLPPRDPVVLGRLAVAVAAATSVHAIGDLTAAENEWRWLETRFSQDNRLKILARIVQNEEPPGPVWP